MIRVHHDAEVTDRELALALLRRGGGNEYGRDCYVLTGDGRVVWRYSGHSHREVEERYDAEAQWRKPFLQAARYLLDQSKASGKEA